MLGPRSLRTCARVKVPLGCRSFGDVSSFLQEKYIDTQKLPGLSYHVLHKGQVIHEESLGVRDLDTKEPWTVDTLHNIASMTKSIVTATLMGLYEEGKFELDDPVSKYIPDFPSEVWVSGTSESNMVTKPASPVTIRHLLTHTAGLGYMVLSPSRTPFTVTDRYGWPHTDRRVPIIKTGLGKKLGQPGANCPEDFVELAKAPLAFEPGTAFRYSIAMDCVGHLISVLEGKALDTVVAERILEPLEMNNTAGWHATDEALEGGNLATIYTPSAGDKRGGGDGLEALRMFKGMQIPKFGKNMQKAAGHSGHMGGGNMLSTSSDIFKFVQMMYNKGMGPNGTRVLKTETVEAMMTNQLPGGVDLSDPNFNTHLADGAKSWHHRTCGGPQFCPRGTGFGFGGGVVTNPRITAPVLGPCKEGTYGWLGIFKTEYFIDPKSELACSIHSQVLWGNFGGLEGHARGMYLPDLRKEFAEKVYKEVGVV